MRRSAPGFIEWLLVTFLILGACLVLYKLYQYGDVRQLFPSRLTIAGVDVGGQTRDEAEARLTERYLDAPVTVYHRNSSFQLDPRQAEFNLDFERMMTQAIQERDQQDYWAGFWGFLWDRPIDVDPVPIYADHSTEALNATLRTILLGGNLDQPAQPPQADTSSMSFSYGQAGLETDLTNSIKDIEAALYRWKNRSADLLLLEVEPTEPGIGLLNTLLTNSIQEFEARSGGVGSYYVINLRTGQELSYNPRIPMTGLGTLNIAAMVEVARQTEIDIDEELRSLFSTAATSNETAVLNDLLAVIQLDGDEDLYIVADRLTDVMQSLGMVNTFIGCPVGGDWRCQEYATVANSQPLANIAPDKHFQTTAEDTALLLAMLYDCATFDGGALRAVYDGAVSQTECSLILELMKRNRISSLLERGVPVGTEIAHRHAWLSDTYGDAGIVFTDAAEYVIVEFTHKPGYLDWDISSTLMADLSRGTFNYFNFDDPYLDQ